jgi:hypothetical protein
MRGWGERRSEPRPFTLRQPSTPPPDASRFDRADRIGAYWATPRHPRGARRDPVLPATEAILSGRSR